MKSDSGKLSGWAALLIILGLGLSGCASGPVSVFKKSSPKISANLDKRTADEVLASYENQASNSRAKVADSRSSSLAPSWLGKRSARNCATGS